jgi:hypothetical protein
MVTENQEPESVDPITAIQQDLDVEQGLDASTPALSPEQEAAVKVMMADQAKSYERQLSGVNKQLNGMTSRLDRTRNELVDIAKRESDTAFERLMSVMDEDQQRAARAWREADKVNNPQSDPTQPAAQELTPAQMEQIHQYVEGFGVNRNDPSLQAFYETIRDPSATEAQRLTTLQQGIAQANKQGTPTPTAATNPPVDRGAAASGNAGRPQTPDALMDAHIEGRMTTEQYKERMAAIGHPV